MTTETVTGGNGQLTRRTVAFLGLGAVVATICATFAPTDWVEGEGSTRLQYEASVVVQAQITVGDPAPVSFAGSIDGGEIVLTYPRGVPVDDVIEATIVWNSPEGAVRPDLGSLLLQVELPNGDIELIPVARWDEPNERVIASRHPPHGAPIVLGLLGLVVVLWVSEAIPLFVTSLLIPVVLVFSGVTDAGEATAPFFNPIIVLFFAGFLMAEAMRRVNLDHYIAVTITARSGSSPGTLFAVMLALAAALSMFMSNTAAAVVLIPIAIAITAPLDNDAYRRMLVLGIAYAATIGGVGSAIGTPANQLAIEFLGEYAGRSISFIEWFAFGLPMVLLFLPLMGWYLWKRGHIDVDRERFAEARAVAKNEQRSLGRPGSDQMIVLGVFGVVVAGWLTQTFHGYHAGIIALAGAVALFILGRLLPEDLARISWSSLLTFGGGLTLGVYLVETGVSDSIATRLTGLGNVPILYGVLAVAAITLLLTTVASNTASAAILIPIAIPLAAVIGVNPVALVIVVAIASSIDFALIVGTPPTMVAYATDLYTSGQIFRTGIVLDVAGLLILVLGVTRVWEFLGLI